MAYFQSASLLAHGERDSPSRRISTRRFGRRLDELAWQYSRAASLHRCELYVRRRCTGLRHTVWQFPLPLVEIPGSVDPDKQLEPAITERESGLPHGYISHTLMLLGGSYKSWSTNH
jgi:hypothetical protein